MTGLGENGTRSDHDRFVEGSAYVGTTQATPYRAEGQ